MLDCRDVGFNKLKELIDVAYGREINILDFDYYDLMEIVEFEISEKMSFWWPLYDIMATEVSYDEGGSNCPIHYSRLVKVTSEGDYFNKVVCLDYITDTNSV